MNLRPYQKQAVSCIIQEWMDHASTLLVVPTGGGKTQIFSEIVRVNLPRRSMVIVHREELAFQARARIDKIAGIKCDIEMAEMKADESCGLFDRSPCVIASVQTLYRRLDKFDPFEFSVLIADECFPAGTIVSGQRIETLRIGDAIRTHLGEGCVTHVFRNEARAICEITTDSGRRLVCTPDHPIWTQFGFMPARLLTSDCMMQRTADDRSGNRRLLTQPDLSPQTGHQERRVPILDRVESVAIYKRGSGEGFSRLCPEGFVYNVEVSNGNTYFADGFLVHNCHHSTASTWRLIIDHFRQNPDLKILGVTATPDRSDEEALGQIFETVAFDYEILDAIHDGWLVPIDQQMVHIGGLDFSDVRTTAGDLNGGDLAAVMESEKNLQGMVGSSIQIIGDRPSILFAASVRHAEQCADIFNRHRAGMAEFICGKTDTDTRRAILERYQNRKTQVLCNVGIATEGFDAPHAAVILNGRPTKSRSLYAQIAGRALRPLTGLVDGLKTADERKLAIAESAKPSALIIDFVGNSGKHKLVSCADILGGKVSEEAIELATARARSTDGQSRMGELLDECEEKIRKEREERRIADAARRARLVARVEFRTTSINPFDVFDLPPVKERGWDNGKTLTEKQRALLQKHGMNPDEMTFQQGRAVLNEMFRRWGEHLATFKQCKLLQKYGYDTKDMTMEDAGKLITGLANNGWKRPQEAVA